MINGQQEVEEQPIPLILAINEANMNQENEKINFSSEIEEDEVAEECELPEERPVLRLALKNETIHPRSLKEIEIDESLYDKGIILAAHYPKEKLPIKDTAEEKMAKYKFKQPQKKALSFINPGLIDITLKPRRIPSVPEDFYFNSSSNKKDNYPSKKKSSCCFWSKGHKKIMSLPQGIQCLNLRHKGVVCGFHEDEHTNSQNGGN